jgi:hypothetical protein
LRLRDLYNAAWGHHLSEEDVQALVKAERIVDFTHRWEKGRGWYRDESKPVPTAKQVNEWSIQGMGHDAINAGVCIQAKCEREGAEVECVECKGEGEIWLDAEEKRRHDEWKEEEPPIGEGYQLWQTTSEGSPVSPVFKTLEELCEWAEKNADVFAGIKTSKEEWKKMLGGNFVSVTFKKENGDLVTML